MDQCAHNPCAYEYPRGCPAFVEMLIKRRAEVDAKAKKAAKAAPASADAKGVVQAMEKALDPGFVTTPPGGEESPTPSSVS